MAGHKSAEAAGIRSDRSAVCRARNGGNRGSTSCRSFRSERSRARRLRGRWPCASRAACRVGENDRMSAFAHRSTAAHRWRRQIDRSCGPLSAESCVEPEWTWRLLPPEIESNQTRVATVPRGRAASDDHLSISGCPSVRKRPREASMQRVTLTFRGYRSCWVRTGVRPIRRTKSFAV